MRKHKPKFPLPLEIDCTGLSRKLIHDLADRLALHFVVVNIDGTDISAVNPINITHYGQAWDIIDRYGVKAR